MILLITRGKLYLNECKAERLFRTSRSLNDRQYILRNNIHATCRCHYILIILLSDLHSAPHSHNHQLQEGVFEGMLNSCFLNRKMKGKIFWNTKYKITNQTVTHKPEGVLSKVDHHIHQLCFISQFDHLSG